MKKFLPIILLVLAGIAAFTWFGPTGFVSRLTPTSPDDKYVDARVGEAYAAIVTSGNNASAARSAAKKALELKPDNGYHDYLYAAALAQEEDLAGATAALKQGNQKPEVIHYLANTPAHENQGTLAKVRLLATYAGKLAGTKDPAAGAYFTELRSAGYRIAALEPITTLSLAAGVSILKQVYTDGNRYYASVKSPDQAKWQADEKKFSAWVKTYRDRQAELLGQMTVVIAKEAGLTEEEAKDVAMHKPLADPARQRLVEEAQLRIVEKEREVLKQLANELPR